MNDTKLPIKYSETHWSIRRDVRNEYVRLQKGLCYHCGSDLGGPPSREVRSQPITRELFPPNFFKHPVHLHHDHDADLTIGAVHARCNAVLWEYYGE